MTRPAKIRHGHFIRQHWHDYDWLRFGDAIGRELRAHISSFGIAISCLLSIQRDTVGMAAGGLRYAGNFASCWHELSMAVYAWHHACGHADHVVAGSPNIASFTRRYGNNILR